MVDEWGRRFVRHQAIRAWSDRELIGAKGFMTVRLVTTQGASVSVVGDWRCNFYTVPGTFIFRIEGEKVAEWRDASCGIR